MKSNLPLIPNILKELTEDISNHNYNYDPELETYLEFKSHPGTEIGSINNQPDQLYLAILLDEQYPEESKELILEDFTNNLGSFIQLLINLTDSIFSENTNSDACSHSIKINTNHADTNPKETLWEIQIKVTDSLS